MSAHVQISSLVTSDRRWLKHAQQKDFSLQCFGRAFPSTLRRLSRLFAGNRAWTLLPRCEWKEHGLLQSLHFLPQAGHQAAEV